MTCYRPWTAFKSVQGVVSQKRTPDCSSLSLPCGNCIGCHLDRSLSWSIRCRHEASCWDNNAFVTLTYDDKHLPRDGSLDKEAPRLFIRYLRRHITGVQAAPGSSARPIRYFGCGEYGSQRGRAHYHLLLFNVRFTDRHTYGKETYTSDLLSKLWTYGDHLVGDVTAASASYVAGYALKKVSAWEREQVYGDRVPEFPMMSLKPAIGQYWYDKYKSDLRHGYVVADGKQLPVPRFYRDKLAVDNPSLFEEMEWRRFQKASSFDPADRSEARLADRELVMQSRKKFFKQSHLED